MKVHLVIPMTVLVSVALVPLMKIRKKAEESEDKQSSIIDIKMRVTNDVLAEYQSERTDMKKRLDDNSISLRKLEDELKFALTTGERMRTDVDICHGLEKSATDELALAETEFNHLVDSTENVKAQWKQEMDILKGQLAAPSLVCDFIKEDALASTLCPKNPKAEAPKPEEPKADVPKPEEPKADVPKPEGPKADVPKPEEPKADVPKPEEPKADVPKPEEPKADVPKPEEPKPQNL